jgi:endonuclease YncB( thermonuclease family)
MIYYHTLGAVLAVSVLMAGTGPLTFAADFLGPVIGVLDGDTIEVLHNQRPERVCLNGIDCPEKG